MPPKRKQSIGIMRIQVEADDLDSGHVVELVRAFKWAIHHTYGTPKIKTIKADFEEHIVERNWQKWSWDGRDLKDLDKHMDGQPVDDYYKDYPGYSQRPLPRIGQ